MRRATSAALPETRHWRARRDTFDAEAFSRALPILHRRGIRYMTLQGGEPLVHPEIVRLVSDTTATGISCAVITNGWFLPRYIEAMAAAGLSRLIVSIDSANLAEHERNRGLEGLERRLFEGIAQARVCGLPVQASVTVNRLVCYDELPDTLRRLGFDCASFSYPRREPFGSTSLVYDGESHLVDLDRDELLAALEAIGRLSKQFPVLNPRVSLAEVARFVRGEPQAVPCIGGHKYFYLDWNLDIWRCEAWTEPLGSVFDLDRIPNQREACNACMMACYRNASMLMHAGVAATQMPRGHSRPGTLEERRQPFSGAAWCNRSGHRSRRRRKCAAWLAGGAEGGGRSCGRRIDGGALGQIADGRARGRAGRRGRARTPYKRPERQQQCWASGRPGWHVRCDLGDAELQDAGFAG